MRFWIEKAQAEIARLQALINEFCDKAEHVLAGLPQ